MSFTPSNVLLRALQIGDMYEIAGALIGYIDADPRFWSNDFDMALNYVLSNGISESQLFKEFDSSFRFEEDSANWVDDYYSYARLYLQKNFCRKRLEHVKAVARKKYGPKPAPNPTTIPQNKTQVQHSQMQKKDQARQDRAQNPNQNSHTGANPIAIAIGIVVVLIIVTAILVIVNI